MSKNPVAVVLQSLGYQRFTLEMWFLGPSYFYEGGFYDNEPTQTAPVQEASDE